MEIIILNHQVGWIHPTQDHLNLRKNPIITKMIRTILIILGRNNLFTI